jgi:hypothetical protein
MLDHSRILISLARSVPNANQAAQRAQRQMEADSLNLPRLFAHRAICAVVASCIMANCSRSRETFLLRLQSIRLEFSAIRIFKRANARSIQCYLLTIESISQRESALNLRFDRIKTSRTRRERDIERM